jgi:hypothetical protein
MTFPSLSRRAFLATSGAVTLAACAGSSSRNGESRSAGDTGAGSGKLQSLRVSSDLYVSRSPQRFAFIFTRDGDFVDAGEATIAVRPQGGSFGDDLPARLHTEGLPDGRGVYTVDLQLPAAGIWEGRATLAGRPTKLFFQVGAQAIAPIPGQAAPRAASPTPATPLGVDPICTREPACDLHATSLDTLVGRGRAVGVLFATPARCQTRYCGPVLDQVLSIAPDYRDAVDLAHVEIYASLDGTGLVPTVTDWGLDSEPWFFTIGPDGTIQERLDGAFATDEIRAALDRVVA